MLVVNVGEKRGKSFLIELCEVVMEEEIYVSIQCCGDCVQILFVCWWELKKKLGAFLVKCRAKSRLEGGACVCCKV